MFLDLGHFKDISIQLCKVGTFSFMCALFLLYLNISILKSETPMKLNIHLECVAMRKDPLTEKTKCQILFC